MTLAGGPERGEERWGNRRLADALRESEKAVGVYRSLAVPGRPAHKSGLARALVSLASALRESGQVRPGSIITVTAALRPPGQRDHHGHGGDGGGGNGQGGGYGGD